MVEKRPQLIEWGLQIWSWMVEHLQSCVQVDHDGSQECGAAVPHSFQRRNITLLKSAEEDDRKWL